MAQNSYQALRFRQPLAYHQYLMRHLHQQTKQRNEAFAQATQSKAGMEEYIREAKNRFQMIIGDMPERSDLKAQIVGRIKGEGFWVEKIVFQATPGRYVTAHL